MSKNTHLITGVVLLLACCWVPASQAQIRPNSKITANRSNPIAKPAPSNRLRKAAREQAQSLSAAFKEAANEILPAVVKIKATSSNEVVINGMFAMPLPEQEGVGSGVIIELGRICA